MAAPPSAATSKPYVPGSQRMSSRIEGTDRR